jgi:hypothetical protein
MLAVQDSCAGVLEPSISDPRVYEDVDEEVPLSTVEESSKVYVSWVLKT